MEVDRWDELVGRISSLVTQHLGESGDRRGVAAEILRCLGALDEIHRAAMSGTAGKPEGAVSEAPSRPRGRRRGANTYRIERLNRGLFLAEYRSLERQPFRCPQDAYEVAVRIVARQDAPKSFGALHGEMNKEVGGPQPDYLLRTCLRFWLSADQPLVQEVRSRYGPVRRSSFARDAHARWAELADKAEWRNWDSSGTAGHSRRSRGPEVPQQQPVARSSKDLTERAGFEPAVRLLPHTLSKRARSATPAPLQAQRCERSS